MTDNRNLNPDEERIDAVDHIIFKELGEQARLKQKMQEWEERKRKQLRLRLLPVVSNIASVAALFVMGIFLQAMLPKTNLSTPVSGNRLTEHRRVKNRMILHSFFCLFFCRLAFLR